MNGDGVVVNDATGSSSVPSSAPKKKARSRKDRNRDSTAEEVMPTKSGTRSRPTKDTVQLEISAQSGSNTAGKEDVKMENLDKQCDVIPLQTQPQPTKDRYY